MFSGIVEERGRVRATNGRRLLVECATVRSDSQVGSSVAVSGVCLTVVDRDGEGLAFDLSSETLERTGLGRLGEGDDVNLERPLTLATRLGGHIVQGHVDGIGMVETVDAADDDLRIRIKAPEELLRYIVEKGSIAVDGVSLTIAGVNGHAFDVAIVPHTREVTTLGRLRTGDTVNLEIDVVAKYVEQLMRSNDERRR